MKRIILVAALSLFLSGCATPFGTTLKNIGTAISVGTTSISNPVTPTRLNQMESALTLVFAGLNTWRDTCARGLLPASCKQQITAVQVYTRQIPPYLTQLRTFVKTNDQVSAVAVFNNLANLVETIKAQAAAGGAPIGSSSALVMQASPQHSPSDSGMPLLMLMH